MGVAKMKVINRPNCVIVNKVKIKRIDLMCINCNSTILKKFNSKSIKEKKNVLLYRLDRRLVKPPMFNFCN